MPMTAPHTGRRLAAVVVAALLLPAAAPQPKPAAKAPVNWVQVVQITPQGGLRTGNPAARVKLLEFGSFTCPTCARFEAVGVPAIAYSQRLCGKCVDGGEWIVLSGYAICFHGGHSLACGFTALYAVHQP